jgi:hypothetical protein
MFGFQPCASPHGSQRSRGKKTALLHERTGTPLAKAVALLQV